MSRAAGHLSLDSFGRGDHAHDGGMETHEHASRSGTARLTVVIERGPDVDAEELDLLARQLRDQLLQLDVDDVQPLRDQEPAPGSKAVDPTSVGAMAVTLGTADIPGVIGLVQGWLRGRPAAAVKVTLGRDSIELTNATAAQVEQLTRAFLARH